MKRITYISIIIAILLTACSPSEAKMAEYLAETMAAMPTQTPIPLPTKIPLADIQLNEIIKSTTDYLPTGNTLGQFSDMPPEMYMNEIGHPVNIQTVHFMKNGEQNGLISILVYDNQDDYDKTYQMMYKSLGENASTVMPDYGTLSFQIIRTGYYKINFVDAVLKNCNTIFIARFGEPSDELPVMNYLKYLSAEVYPYVCK